MHLNYKIAVAVVLYAAVVNAQQDKRTDKRQVLKTGAIETAQDKDVAETGFGGGLTGHSKYFQDIYSAQLAPDKIEFGHVRETPDDWEQRFERKDLGQNRHQGKVRWGDKHGGYGEHYWDYNHAGHGGDDGEHGAADESQAVHEYDSYEPSGSSAVSHTSQPEYNSASDSNGYTSGSQRAKRQQQKQQIPRLVYDPTTGYVKDELSGQLYRLQPIKQ